MALPCAVAFALSLAPYYCLQNGPENLTIPDRVESLGKQTEATMDKAIQVTVKDVYGSRAIYPACDTAKLLAKLAGTKTITTQALETIKQLGYTVEVAQPTL